MIKAEKDRNDEVRNDATDSRTLDEIEADEEVPSSEPESRVPAPDEGGGRESDSDLDSDLDGIV